jgi:hypothetical protein
VNSVLSVRAEITSEIRGRRCAAAARREERGEPKSTNQDGLPSPDLAAAAHLLRRSSLTYRLVYALLFWIPASAGMTETARAVRNPQLSAPNLCFLLQTFRSKIQTT